MDDSIINIDDESDSFSWVSIPYLYVWLSDYLIDELAKNDKSNAIMIQHELMWKWIDIDCANTVFEWVCVQFYECYRICRSNLW